MVYAAGGPPAGALRAIVHTMAPGNGGGAAPGSVHTGTVGLARDHPVRVFGPRDDAMIRHRTSTSLLLAAARGAVLAVLLGLVTPIRPTR